MKPVFTVVLMKPVLIAVLIKPVLHSRWCCFAVLSYKDCPRNYAKGMWWDPVPFGEVAAVDCPEGAFGQ